MHNVVELITAKAQSVHDAAMHDLSLLKEGHISIRDAQTRAKMAKIALDALKIEVLASPLAIAYVRDPHQYAIAAE